MQENGKGSKLETWRKLKRRKKAATAKPQQAQNNIVTSPLSRYEFIILLHPIGNQTNIKSQPRLPPHSPLQRPQNRPPRSPRRNHKPPFSPSRIPTPRSQHPPTLQTPFPYPKVWLAMYGTPFPSKPALTRRHYHHPKST